MKTSSILLLAGALTLAAGTALVARALMRPPPPVTIIKEVAAPRAPDVMVLSASRVLQPGDFIGPAEMAWRKLATQAAADQITATSDAERLERERELLGAALRIPLDTDTPITRNVLVHPGKPGFIAAVLAPGMRAISIPTSAVSSNAGLVSAGDYVDVILSIERGPDPDDDSKRSPFSVLAAQTILRNVRVLALNNKTDSIAPAPVEATDDAAKAKEQSPVPVREFYETITLEVPPAAAEKLAVAKEVGILQVALRGSRERLDDDHDHVVASAGAGVTRLNDATSIFVGRSVAGPQPAARPIVVHSFRGNTRSEDQFTR